MKPEGDEVWSEKSRGGSVPSGDVRDSVKGLTEYEVEITVKGTDHPILKFHQFSTPHSAFRGSSDAF